MFIIVSCKNRTEDIVKVTEVFRCHANTFNTENGEFVSEKIKKIYKFDEIFSNTDTTKLILFDSRMNNFYLIDLCLGGELMEYNFGKDKKIGFFELDSRFFVNILSPNEVSSEIWELEYSMERLEIVELETEDLKPMLKLY